jgi:hypothetical protein
LFESDKPKKDVIYNDDYHTYQFCGGTQWFSMRKPIPGYFVLTRTAHDGNLGSIGNNLNAPDAKCLADLTSNTSWKGHPTAKKNGRLIAAKMHAFLCTEGICNNLIPLTTYYFANAGDSAAGGASFTTDTNGDGPNDSASWSWENHFKGDYVYWTGYRSPRDDSSWLDIPTGGGYQCKATNPWDTGARDAKAVYGHSVSTDRGRWWAGNHTCNESHHLICYVDP